jgi:hypothetical protein
MRLVGFMPKLLGRGLRSAAELAVDRPHGDRLRYLAGCKCFKCRRANSAYEAQRKVARADGDWNGIIDAAPARRHILKLSRLGVGRHQVAAASDVASSIVCGIRSGARRRARARTVRKILAVTTGCRADNSYVKAAPTWRLINALLKEGFTKARLARELGYKSPAIQFRFDRITVRNATAMEKLYRRYAE